MYGKVLSLVVLLAACVAAEERSRELSVKPDRDVQSQIDRAVKAVLRTKPDARLGFIEPEMQPVLDLAKQQPTELVQQLVFYWTRGRADEEERLRAFTFLNVLRIPELAIAKAAVSLLDCEDQEASAEAERLLGMIDKNMTSRSPDYSHYVSLVGPHESKPPQSLIRYMFQRSPSEALLTYKRTFVRDIPRLKELLWAEHVVSDTLWKQQHGFLDRRKVEPEAAVQIEKAAVDQEWWVRLYAAEIMRQHPAFRKPELLQKLAKDENALVRESAEATLAPPKPKPKPSPTPPPSYPSTKELKK